jgi:hypothetical protein
MYPHANILFGERVAAMWVERPVSEPDSQGDKRLRWVVPAQHLRTEQQSAPVGSRHAPLVQATPGIISGLAHVSSSGTSDCAISSAVTPFLEVKMSETPLASVFTSGRYVGAILHRGPSGFEAIGEDGEFRCFPSQREAVSALQQATLQDACPEHA